MNSENINDILEYMIDAEKEHFIESYNSGDSWKEHIYLKVLQLAVDFERTNYIPQGLTLTVVGGNDPEFSDAGEESTYNLEFIAAGRPTAGTDGSVDDVEGLIAFLDNQYPQSEFFKVVSIEEIA